MSFILDALKKADRERNLNKIPTLTTVHIPVYMTSRRVTLWVVAATILGGVGLAWWLQAPTEPPVPTVQPGPSVAVAPPARPTAPESGPASGKVASVPPPAVPESALPVPAVAPRSQAPRQGDGDGTGSPPSRPAARRQPQPPTAPIQPEVTELRPVQVISPVVPSPRPEPQPSVEASQPTSPAIPAAPPVAPPPAPPTTPTLREALSKMTLDVFVYTDVEADRMAVINGRRYFKGQLVDGLYLVESINPDGVMLKYQDERAVLRP
jgi:general secretion pathway protein B